MNGSRIWISPFGGVRFSDTLASGLHAQHAVTVLVGLDGDVSVDTSSGSWRGRVLGVPADLAHRATCEGPALAFLYDPERAEVGRLVEERPAVFDGRRSRSVNEAIRAHQGRLSDPSVLAGLSGEVLAAAGPLPAPPLDPRVARALALFREPSEPRMTVAATARALGLSAAHFRDLFGAAIGISPRRYQKWTVLVRALSSGLGVQSLTDLAYAGGFADLAHFSRTCRNFIGYSPSVLSMARTAADRTET